MPRAFLPDEGSSAAELDQGQHLARVERDLRRLRDRLTRLAGRGENEALFNQAIRLASRGASVREIMETCGLSQVEADLVVLLHHEDPRNPE